MKCWPGVERDSRVFILHGHDQSRRFWPVDVGAEGAHPLKSAPAATPTIETAARRREENLALSDDSDDSIASTPAEGSYVHHGSEWGVTRI